MLRSISKIHTCSARSNAHCHRLLQSISTRSYHELSFESHGEPETVLGFRSVAEEPLADASSLPDSDVGLVRVEMWHAPWNPADINTIQGKYPSPYSNVDPKRDMIRKSRSEQGRTVAGSEGWGFVTDASGESSTVQVGDVVTVGAPALGTFRSSLWVPSTSVVPLKQGMELKTILGASASALPQLGGTALRMLRDFCSLAPGDIVLQNAGNSGVGFMASQLGKFLQDVTVVSLVRRGHRKPDEWEELVEHLTTSGRCAKVVAEEDLNDDKQALKKFQSELRDLSATHKLPQLGLNAVGGESASLVSRCLEQGGTMVTYGGMSQRPVTTSTAQFIFRDIRLAGYWHSRWMVQSTQMERQNLMDELSDAVISGGVTCPPVEAFPLAEFQRGLQYDAKQSGSSIRRKVIFECQ